MGYNRGSFRRGTVNAKGTKGRTTGGRFNARVTKSGFKQLASAVQSAAGVTAREVLSDRGSYRMSFDEAVGIPTNVPGSGTLTMSGLGDNPVEAEATMQLLAQQAVNKMQEAFVAQIKEMGL